MSRNYITSFYFTLFVTATSATTSLFGGQQSTGAFGAKSTSIFGGSSSSPSTGGGGLFSGGSGSVVSQGFGMGQTTPVKSGFGAPPAFGGAPAFGSPPAFGALAAPSSPVFGGAPALGAGAVPSVFGASSISAPTTVFGSSLASDVPTFGSMGGGGSTFGNLSQQGNIYLSAQCKLKRFKMSPFTKLLANNLPLQELGRLSVADFRNKLSKALDLDLSGRAEEEHLLELRRHSAVAMLPSVRGDKLLCAL